jgi:cytochrome P450/NADPH-cytochrome P450 reductase
LNRLQKREAREAQDAQAYMGSLVQSLVDNRKAQGDAADNSDLLGVMLTGTDKTGQHLSEENIVAQCITFLVAGHETTSGLLSFAVYYLLKDPDVLEGARAEVDAEFGDNAYPSYDQVRKLTYVFQILEETLRLWAPAPLISRTPREDTIIGGKYVVPAGSQLTMLIPALHRSEAAWGPTAEDFDPDRMSIENQAKLPPDVYKPFGTGMRACIGRKFAL